MGRSLFERLGYNDSGYNSQSRFETNTANMKNTMRIFSAMIGLRAMTDATRIASLGVSADILNSRITELLAIPEKERFRRLSNLEDLTVGQYQAVKELESWGMDVPGVLNTISMINRADPQKLEHLMFELTMGIPVDQTEGLQKLLGDEGLVTKVGVDNLEAGLAAEVKRLEDNVS